MYYPTCIEYIKLAPSYIQKVKCGCWEEKVDNVEKGSPQPLSQGVDGDVGKELRSHGEQREEGEECTSGH